MKIFHVVLLHSMFVYENGVTSLPDSDKSAPCAADMRCATAVPTM